MSAVATPQPVDTNIFSSEVPSLLKEHFDQLRASAISPDVMKERGYLSILGGKDQRLKEWGFSSKQQRGGLILPMHGVEGKVINHILRPDKPRLNEDGKPIKYEQPKGTNVHFDVPPRCLKYLGDPNVPLWIVEGQKKDDSLASAGAECVIGLTGVWGFRGKNDRGGKTYISDIGYIAWNGRHVFIVYDSDMWSNRHVSAAFLELKNLCVGKESIIHTLRLSEGKDGHKNGADDFLAAGHTLQDIKDLETGDEPRKVTRQGMRDLYTIDASGFYFLKPGRYGSFVEVPVANFVARIKENLILDDGVTSDNRLIVEGMTTDTNERLPLVEIPNADFDSMSWVRTKWGSKAFFLGGVTRDPKAIMVTNIMKASRDAVYKTFHTHTGWKKIDEEMVYLTGAGAIGKKNINVDLLEGRLKPYQIPEPEGDLVEAIKTSLDFMGIGKEEVLLPLWSEMFLAPLCEIIHPTFSLWIYGPSGVFKSVVSGLALSHYGSFDKRNLPGNWHDTGGFLEKLAFILKDAPYVIDDFAPGQDPAKAKELEVKAEYIIRDQGNLQGRGRMIKDKNGKIDYYPRGLVIVTGEQDPSGHSFSSRVISVQIEKGDIQQNLLTEAQRTRRLYSTAMGGYLLWLKNHWRFIQDEILGAENPVTKIRTGGIYEQYWLKACSDGQHPRIPEAVACLYLGLNYALAYAADSGALVDSRRESILSEGWDIFQKWGAEQNRKTEEERPGRKFIESLLSLMESGRARLANKEDEIAAIPSANTYDIGWKDDGFILLNPKTSFAAVREFCLRTGDAFTWRDKAVWDDLKRLGMTECTGERNQKLVRIYGAPTWVVKLKKTAIYPEEPPV